MELRDLLVTPVVIFAVYLAAYAVRKRFTDKATMPYYFPALTLKLTGALALGLIYQFYYGGGDTFNFHTHGSRHVWDAFQQSVDTGTRLLFSNGSSETGFYSYSSKIPFFRDPSAFMVIRIATLCDLITFSTYSATAVLFGVFSFAGSWMLFLTFYHRYPASVKGLAIAALFLPSVVFWASGLLKDTLVFACLGMITYEIDRLFIRKQFSWIHTGVLIIAVMLTYSIKKFVLQAYIPTALLWIYLANLKLIRPYALRVITVPFLFAFILFGGYYAAQFVGEGDSRYALNKLAETSKITAVDIRYQTGRFAGSGYSLGQLDGTLGTMVSLTPQAINVSLFRPYLWEVKNPLMLLTAMESLGLFILTVFVLYKVRSRIPSLLLRADVAFCMLFSLVFAFAVGVSTYNFGTLARYKTPFLPFYVIALLLILHLNKERKVSELEATE